MRVVRLEEAASLSDTVADRIWRAWWRDEGHPRTLIVERLAESLNPEPVPTTFVAVARTTFLGTVSIVASDLDERPDLAPWIAAPWVEPEQRGRGVGAALVSAAVCWARSTASRPCISPPKPALRAGIGAAAGTCSKATSGDWSFSPGRLPSNSSQPVELPLAHKKGAAPKSGP